MGFDPVIGMKGPTVDALAAACCHGPGFLGLQVSRPERPGSTLHRPDGIDSASHASVRLERQENAIAIVLSLCQAETAAHLADILAAYLCLAEAYVPGDGGDFLLRDPNVAFFRPGTALSAASAFKGQSGDIPRCFVGKELHHLTV